MDVILELAGVRGVTTSFGMSTTMAMSMRQLSGCRDFGGLMVCNWQLVGVWSRWNREENNATVIILELAGVGSCRDLTGAVKDNGWVHLKNADID